MMHWQKYRHSRAQHREFPASGNHTFLIVLSLWFHLQWRSVKNLQYSALLRRYDMSTGLKKSYTVLLPCAVGNCTHGEHKKNYEAGQVVVGIVHSCGWNLLFIATSQICESHSWKAKATKLQGKVTCGADFTAGKFCHPPGSGTGKDSESTQSGTCCRGQTQQLSPRQLC